MPVHRLKRYIWALSSGSTGRGIIFFRHSLPSIDPAIPACEWHLSEEGRQRCYRLAAQLPGFHPQIIISSLEPKAIETAQIVAERLDLPYETAQDLHEHVRVGENYSTVEDFEASVKVFFEQPHHLVFGSETADQAHCRFAQAITDVNEKYPGHNPIVIVSHGTVISLFVSRVYGIDPFNLWKALKLPCIVILSSPNPQILSLDFRSPKHAQIYTG